MQQILTCPKSPGELRELYLVDDYKEWMAALIVSCLEAKRVRRPTIEHQTLRQTNLCELLLRNQPPNDFPRFKESRNESSADFITTHQSKNNVSDCLSLTTKKMAMTQPWTMSNDKGSFVLKHIPGYEDMCKVGRQALWKFLIVEAQTPQLVFRSLVHELNEQQN